MHRNYISRIAHNCTSQFSHSENRRVCRRKRQSRFESTLAGRAALPEFFRLGIGLLALGYALADVTITDPQRAPAVVEAAMTPIDPVVTAATVGTVIWQWYLLTGGLCRDADLPWNGAAVVVAIPLSVRLFIALA